MTNMLNKSTLRSLAVGLDVSSLRHRVIADNIANAETPGYKKKEVSFAEVFDRLNNQSFSKGRASSFAFGVKDDRRGVKVVQGVSHRNDGNNVDIDEEMTKLAQNTLYYQALSHQINAHFQQLRTVINDGRK